MKISISVFLLFVGQLLLSFLGVRLFGTYVNPVLLLIVSLCIAGIYFNTLINHKKQSLQDSSIHSRLNYWFLIIFGLLLSVCFIVYTHSFVTHPDTHRWSDVIPQLEALWDRFARGEQPYYPLEEFSWHPFPVYMPMHWLPVGIARLSHTDSRVIGMLMLCLALLVYAFQLIPRYRTLWGKAMILVMPIFILLAFLFVKMDIIFTLETIIAAYYLLLALGLSGRNIWLTTIGIILCLMSRYTMVFWLPLFAILLWFNVSFKQSIAVWGTIVTAIVLIYVIPFYLPAPSALLSGIKYHNNAAIGEWESWQGTFAYGIYFAPHMRQLFAGTMENRVFLARIVQASCMLFLLGGGLIAYKKVKATVSFYDFSLGMLYLVILCFYMFGPLTYLYYLISLFFLSALLCAKVIEYREQDSA